MVGQCGVGGGTTTKRIVRPLCACESGNEMRLWRKFFFENREGYCHRYSKQKFE